MGFGLNSGFDGGVDGVLARRKNDSWLAQTQLLNWLFVLDGGGLAGMSTLAATRNEPLSAKVALWSFALGLLALVAWAVRRSAFEARRFRLALRDAEDLRAGRISHVEFLRREQVRVIRTRLGAFLGWTSGVLSVAGFVEAMVSVLTVVS